MEREGDSAMLLRDFGFSIFLHPPKYLKKHNEVPHFTHTTKFMGCKK